MQFKLKQYIYFCADMRKMIEFYTQVLGLKPEKDKRYPPEEWLRLKGLGFYLCLHKSNKPGAKSGNRNKLVFEVADVGKARAYLNKKKIKMGEHHRWPGMEACDGHDPEGNKFQIARYDRG